MAEAEVYADLARELADEDDTTSQALWRTAIARVRASEGRAAEAVELCEAAVGLVTGTAAVALQGDIHAEFAAVLQALGRAEDAGTELDVALGFYARKGDTASAVVARASLARIAVS
jgi:hypothetical protein